MHQENKQNTPKIEINDNGNWVIDGVDTGVSAKGEKGDKGEDGKDLTIDLS